MEHQDASLRSILSPKECRSPQFAPFQAWARSEPNTKAMRIAQIAPLYESVPPKLYGGTERVVAHLTDELVRRGHEVVLFASADSKTSAELVPCRDVALRLDNDLSWDIPAHLSMLAEVRNRAHEFDVLHFHLDCFHLPFFHDRVGQTLTTMHGRQDIRDLGALHRHYPNYPLVSISNSQRRSLPHLNWVKTIHHGYPKFQYTFSSAARGGYLAFLGRISPEKGLDRAIEIARQSGIPLRVAAKIDRADKDYFEARIEPLLKGPGIEFIGEIGEGEKSEFLGRALALLFPISWPEPFGLVMIEAMACGTPVIAFPRGSAPEVVKHGVTGFIVETVKEAVAAVKEIDAIDRGVVRAEFERRFSVDVMAKNYEIAYADIQTIRGDLDMPAQFEGLNGLRLELESGILAQGTSPRG
jgi:glycosyltransferase involved in cell wall biosynthesis